jgi:hypothetical protein
MAKTRSPNYPNYDLAGALRLAEKVWEKDKRNKVPRAALAAHLGHESLSGPALGKIGALRAYGLLEGGGEELNLSEHAITALKAPAGSDEQKAALATLALNPALFKAIKKAYPATLPSRENLTYWLIKEGFTDTAASIAAKSYLSTMALVEGLGAAYNSDNEQDGAEDDANEPSLPDDKPRNRRVKLMDGERELTTGLLSKESSFRLIVSGPVGVKEIERLISKLEIDKEILAEQEPKEGAA